MSRSNLQRHLDQVRAALRDLPAVALAALLRVSEEAARDRRSPEGAAWPPDKDGRPFDPQGHIRYEPVARGYLVEMRSTHPAARFSRTGTRTMAARPKVPRTVPREVLEALRGRLRGAR